jgi:hypothetical protein
MLFFLLFAFTISCNMPEINDVIPPVTAVIYPYEGAVISANTNLILGATDDEGVSLVWCFIDGVKVGEASAAPYTIALNIGGYDKKVSHVIQAAAQDKSGNVGYSSVVSFIIADSKDIINPTVLILNPQAGQAIRGNINILAYAVDERSVQKVVFFIDGDSAGAGRIDNVYPYQYLWNTTSYADSASHAIFAKVWDGGNNSAISPVVTVTVYPPSVETDDIAPSAAFLYPVSQSIVTGTVKVSVDMRDNIAVIKSEFFVDGILTKSVDNPVNPWIFDWDSSPQADSSLHSLYVRVYDAAGNIGTTGVLTVTVR